MDVTKPDEFIGFGAMDVTKPYEFIGFGANGQQRNAAVAPMRQDRPTVGGGGGRTGNRRSAAAFRPSRVPRSLGGPWEPPEDPRGPQRPPESPRGPKRPPEAPRPEHRSICTDLQPSTYTEGPLAATQPKMVLFSRRRAYLTKTNQNDEKQHLLRNAHLSSARPTMTKKRRRPCTTLCRKASGPQEAEAECAKRKQFLLLFKRHPL